MSKGYFAKACLVLSLFLLIFGSNTVLAAPKPYGTEITEQFFVEKFFNGRALSPVEGIWTMHSQGIEADIAIIPNNTEKYKDYDYVGIIIKTNSQYWHKGEIRLLLQRTASPNYFKASWLIVGPFWQDTKYASSLILRSVNDFETSLVGEYDNIVRISGVKLYPSVASAPVQQVGATGTGFFITPTVVITNAHVVNGCSKITIVYQNDIIRRARVLAMDKDNDVAVLIIDEAIAQIRPLFVANSNSVLVGERAYTLGYPVPDGQGYNAKFTDGLVNSLTGIGDQPRWFQISTPIQPGNSGGPLLDSKGRVIGITSASASIASFYRITGTLPQNVNFAVKSNYILSVMIGLSEGTNLSKNEPTNVLEPTEIAKIASQAVVLIKAEQ
jgi:S1-C subfamily serine protease